MDTLQHHGILGQKWGVQNGPPYPLDENKHSQSEKAAGWKQSLNSKASSQNPEIMKKGTKLNSVSPWTKASDYKRSMTKVYAYRKDNEWDNKVYKGPFAYYKMMTTGYRIYEHAFEAAKDLKMPTDDQRFNEFVQLYDKNVKKYSKNLDKAINLTNSISSAAEFKKENVKFDPRNMVTEEDYRKAYNTFNTLMERPEHYALSRDYTNKIRKNYDAMTDDNNAKVYNEAQTPVVIYNPNRNLTVADKSRALDYYQDIMKNFAEVQQELEKKGKRVAL